MYFVLIEEHAIQVYGLRSKVKHRGKFSTTIWRSKVIALIYNTKDSTLITPLNH